MTGFDEQLNDGAPLNYSDLERAYQQASATRFHPDIVVTTSTEARKFLRPEEVAAIDAFLVANPGSNWHLDRETLIVTALPPDDDEDEDDADEPSLP